MAGFKSGGVYFSRQDSAPNPLSSDKVLLYVNTSGSIIARYSNGLELDLTATANTSGFITRAEVENISGQLQDQINTNASDIASLQGDVAVVSGGVDDNASSIVGLLADVAVVSGGVDLNAANLALVTADVATISGDVVTLTSDVAALQTATSGITGGITQLDDAYVNITGDTMTGNLTIAADLIVNGDAYINGTEFIVNTTHVSASDNIITVNAGEVGPGVTSGYAGITVDRGTEDNYFFLFDEQRDAFVIGTSSDELSGGLSQLQAVATRQDAPTNGFIPTWNDAESRFDTTIDPTAFATDSDVAVVSAGVDQNTADIAVISGGVAQNSADIAVISGAIGSLEFVDLNDTPNSYPASAGAFLQINDSEDGLEFVDYRSEVIAISANLASSIFQNTNDIAQVSNEVTINTADIADHENRITILESKTDALTGSLGTLVVGTENLNTTDSVYTINHPVSPIGGSSPVVSLGVPASASELLVQGITNRTTSSFDVVLSGVPEVSGYQIHWNLNLAGDAFIVKYYNVGTLTPPNLYPDAVAFDTFTVLLNQDTTLFAPTGMVNGQTINIKVEQDAVSGGHDLILDTDYEYPGGAANYTVSSAAEAVDVLTVVKIEDRLFVSAVQNLA